MKAKKFLQIIKDYCREENCESGKCPAMLPGRNDKHKDCCIFSVCSNPEDWDIKEIIKTVKKFKGGKYGN